MAERRRSHLAVRLLGGQQRDGEIPLADLARIATETQLLVRRLARSITDRGGPGRTPTHLEEQSQLLLVGIHDGSTVLEIAGPELEAQLDLGTLPPDAGSQALAAFLDGVDALAHGHPLPDPFDDIASRSMDNWLGALASAASEFEIDAEAAEREWHLPRTSLESAREVLVQSRAAATGLPPDSRVVEGILYAVNLHTGRYSIEDDIGHVITLETSIFTSEDIAPLLGRRVRAEGVPRYDDAGRLQVVEATQLSPGPEIEGFDNEGFWRHVELEELLHDHQPLESMEELAIPGLTEEEIAEFIKAIQE